MKHLVSIVLLSTFGISILLYPIAEAGHEILHSFQNHIHYHDADHHHTLADHKMEQHHNDAVEEDLDTSGFLSFLAGYFKDVYPIKIQAEKSFQNHFTSVVCFYMSPPIIPPNSPPLS